MSHTEEESPGTQMGKASSIGDLDAVERLMTYHALWVDFPLLQDALQDATSGGQVDVCRFLLNNGASPQNIIVWIAVSKMKLDLLDLMLEHGWKINDGISDGATML